MFVKDYIVSTPRIYWILAIPIFLGLSYYSIFFDWQLQHYGVTQAEDFGRYVFVLAISICESIIYILLIRLAVSLSKNLYKNKMQNSSS